MFSNPQVAVPIPLNVWQDPQGDVFLRYSRGVCEVYFGCWNKDRSPADYICKLVFDHAWAVRAYSFEFSPYEIKAHDGKCIFEVQESRWLEMETKQRLTFYPRWKTWDETKYKHFYVWGHDNYYDIIASSFEEVIIPKEDAGDLIFLIEEY